MTGATEKKGRIALIAPGSIGKTDSNIVYNFPFVKESDYICPNMMRVNNKLDLPYVDKDGKHWKTYREYCNSDAPDFDEICVMLDSGRRDPQNDWERNYIKESGQYKRDGIATELPFD